MMRKIMCLLTVALVLSFAVGAVAKTPDEKIADLERQIAALQKTYMDNNQEVVSAVTKSAGIQDEFNGLKGQIETNSHLLKSQREEMMRLINDLQTRVQSIEDKMSVFSSQITSAIGKVSPAAGAEAEAFQKGIDLASSAKYLEAASAFESFIQKYPKSQFVPKAQKWVGECFYNSRDYKRAIKEYQNFIEKNPRDAGVADAILKQGNSFYELGLYEESRAFYEKVIAMGSSSQEAAQAKSKIKRLDERSSTAKATSGGAPSAGQKTSQAGAVQAPSAPAGSSASAYPTETIEQQRARMSGKPVAEQPATPNQPAKTSNKPGVPQKEF